MLYDEGETPFTGDITLQFASGLSVRVDNTQYIGPNVNIDKTTGAFTANSSAPDVVAFISLTDGNANDVIRIGRNFFSAAYLMVNYDSGEFTMWPTAENITSSQDLVAVDTAGAELDDLCSSNETSTVTAGGSDSTGGSTTASTASVDATSSGRTPSPNVPAIAGGVVGGVVGIASISALVICFTLRRRKAKRDAGVVELHHDYMPAGSHASSPRANVALGKLIDVEPAEAQAQTLHELAPESKYYHELPSRGSGFNEGELHGELGLDLETPRFELADNAARRQM
ncbi:hypothetical protein FJTKL_02382 [Diaporthe vaccinii]|uniref:Peptidase A1 domain-containing protein n=1 Tax=Diaporthe vaccinii TaxID=105482 RepID=A0ABR4F3V7_9PEZI